MKKGTNQLSKECALDEESIQALKETNIKLVSENLKLLAIQKLPQSKEPDYDQVVEVLSALSFKFKFVITCRDCANSKPFYTFLELMDHFDECEFNQEARDAHLN